MSAECVAYDAPVTRSPFAQELRRQRLAHGWTQQELAERAGLSTRAISDLERGTNHSPRLVTVRLLSDALGLAPEERVRLLTAARGESPSAAPGTASVGAETSLSPPAKSATEFQIHYARRPDGVRTAYGSIGQGPVLLISPGFVSNLEWWRRAPRNQAFLRLLCEHRSVVVYDRHGCGLSDRDRSDFSPEDDMLDIEAVANAVAGSEPLDLLGDSWGARPTVCFAARHPERVRRMVIYGAAAPGRVSEMFLERRAAMAALRRTDFDLFARSTAMTLFPDGLDQETLEIIVPLLRTAATPEMQEHLESVFFDLDSILSDVHAPTLVLHRRGDQAAPFAHGQRLASRISDARFLAADR